MLCTFCGTENRPEHKFCGMCGVRLERRQTDRRVRKEGVSLTCSVCNHVNESGLKFCGMCGTRVERRVQERRGSDIAAEPRAAAIANAQLPSPEAKSRTITQVIEPPKRREEIPIALPRRAEPAIFRNEPASGGSGNISGPSFLGLGTDKGGDSEYLLEDEPSSGGGLRKLILLAILITIVGLVFVQWRSSVRANPKATPAKTDPATTAEPADKTQPQPEGAATTSPPEDNTTKPADPDAKPESYDATAADPKESKVDPPAKPNESASPVPAASAAEIPDKDKEEPKPDAPPAAATTKPTEDAHLADYKPSSALLRAQQFLRGRGVPQNCEQGLLYLHAATDKSDPGAAIQMAALYASGVCVKQDRVMAYRWFNSAHELQPGNMWIQKNMDQLWAQMSSQERRLAGY